MTITAAELNKLSIEQLEILYRKIQPPTKEQKKVRGKQWTLASMTKMGIS